MARQNMEQFQRKLEKWSRMFPAEAVKAFGNVRTLLVTDIKKNYLSGQVLGVISGKLRSSIRGLIQKNPPVSLTIGTDVDYGAIWFQRGRDFLNPSIKKNMTRIKRMILNNITKSYKKAG